MTADPSHQPPDWELRTTTLVPAEHTLVMAVLNVTPDSFSDGGRFHSADGAADASAAVVAGLTMSRRGADIVDVGGESTRPGSDGVAASIEAERVVGVVAGLAAEGVVVSVDTAKPEVAEAAIAAGAEIVNDITGLADPAMADLCARTGVGVVIMHMQGTPRTMQHDPDYGDVVEEVAEFLEARAADAAAAGIDPRRICLDPGIGFGKTIEHNLALLAGLRRLTSGRYPVLVGTSRKGFLGAVLDRAGHPAAPAGRDAATAATTALAVAAGAAAVRVHDVVSGLQSARTADAIVAAAGGHRARVPASMTER